MAFQQEPVRSPERIDSVTLNLAVRKAADGTTTYEDAFDVRVALSNGDIVAKTGALREHLTAQQIQTVKAFLDAMLLKAETEIL